MNPIISPLQPGDQGHAVADLEDALLLLVDEKLIQAQTAPNHPAGDELTGLVAKVTAERGQSRFADATGQLLRSFQIQQHLGDLGGVVETKTAVARNAALTKFAVLAPPACCPLRRALSSRARIGLASAR